MNTIELKRAAFARIGDALGAAFLAAAWVPPKIAHWVECVRHAIKGQ